MENARDPRVFLELKVHCPYSNVVVDGVRIPPHTLPVTICKNCTLMAWCQEHQTRCFTRESELIRRILKSEAVVDPTLKEAL